MEHPNISPEIKLALTRTNDPSMTKFTEIVITPEDAQLILNTFSYPNQRDIKLPHTGLLADMMAHDQFMSGSLLTFADDQNHKPVLVDGQHRLTAAIVAKWTGTWIIRYCWEPRFSATNIYTILDTSQAPRTNSVIGLSAGFDQLSKRAQRVIVSASRYQNLWRTDYQLPTHCTTPPARDNLARAAMRMQAFHKADQILSDRNGNTDVRSRLYSPIIHAIVAETLYCTPWEAETFWQGVIHNDAGMAAELRNYLIKGRPPKSNAFYLPRLAASAWNARHSDTKLRREYRNLIPLESTNIVVPV